MHKPKILKEEKAMRKRSTKLKNFLLFILGTYGLDCFVYVHTLITACPPYLFATMCVILLAIILCNVPD